MLSIGSAKIPSKILLAPLAGCSDLAFRMIAREHGAKFCFFEMVDTNAVVYGPRRKTISILKTIKKDTPIAAQLLGRDPSMMLKAAHEILELTNIQFLDINAACPAKKAIKKKAGSYLLREPKQLNKIIKKLALSLPVPVTVKLRIGYDKVDHKELKKLVMGCESSGVSAIFIHGRTRSQGYAGEIDYDAIKLVKESVKVPVIGSGNIFDTETSKKMFSRTGCDAITVARGSLGNPWLFTDLENGNNSNVPLKERVSVLKKHLDLTDKYKDLSPSGKVGYMRKIVLWYMRGFPDAPQLRCQISIVKSYEKMLKLLDEVIKK